MKKYELFKEKDGSRLFRIRYIVDIEKYGIKAGDLGGFLESEAIK